MRKRVTAPVGLAVTKPKMMSVITIRRGLRKLEFAAATQPAAGRRRTHVVVDFVMPESLEPGQVVIINLGLRNGYERRLEGIPALVDEIGSESSHEFLYRLEGDVD